MRFLLNTNIFAELAKPKGSPAVISAVAAIVDADIYMSVLTVGEIAKGLALLTVGPKKKHLTAWLVDLERQYGDRILPVDLETARIWGELTARSQKSGIVIPPTDSLLAATALRHGLHVMTRNTRHFEATGVLLINPWEDSSIGS
jgi:predicted nucleic acid-binding protein